MSLDKLNAAAAADQRSEFGLIPPGKYHFEVLDFGERETKNGATYMSLRGVIHGPAHAGRQLFCDFWTSSDAACRISKRQLLDLAGIEEDGPLPDLIGKHYVSDVFIEKGNPKGDGTNWPDRNRQRNFKPYSASEVDQADDRGTSDWDAF